MKSSRAALIDRGFLEKDSESTYLGLSFDEKLKLLRSPIAVERTLGAKLLCSENPEISVLHLIEALKTEKKLYSKIEICNTLVSFGHTSAKPLIEQLGKIGNNQHKTVPQEKFRKKSYPLPRDIAARTLANIGTVVLPDLLKTLSTRSVSQLSEAIDAIGHICFYNYQNGIFEHLFQCFERNQEHELIRWKLVRAMSAFPESEIFLKKQLLFCTFVVDL